MKDLARRPSRRDTYKAKGLRRNNLYSFMNARAMICSVGTAHQDQMVGDAHPTRPFSCKGYSRASPKTALQACYPPAQLRSVMRGVCHLSLFNCVVADLLGPET